MITINNLRLLDVGDEAKLSADVSVGNAKSGELWVSVGKAYSSYLCVERCDAFVMGLLHYAMKLGEDIECDVPMTDRLYEQVVGQFLPAYSAVNNIRCVHVITPVAPELSRGHNGGFVGAGSSCGVDSLHVFARHQDITHCCVWNVHGITTDETPKDRLTAWRNLVAQSERFSSAIGKQLIVCDSNYDRGCFSDLTFDGSTTYGNLFFIFAMQKAWSRYYLASGYDIVDFSLTLGVMSDPAHYEHFLLPLCSLANFVIQLDGFACNRLEKVRGLLAYQPARKFLNVCWNISPDGRNCTHCCPKCMRTVLELAALDSVDEFGDVFDAAYYWEHQEEFLAEYWRGLLQKNPYALEIRNSYGGRRFPVRIRFLASIILARKILKKMLRLGRVGRTFRSKG